MDLEGPGPHVLLELSTLIPGARGPQKGGLVGLWVLSHAFWQKLYRVKVAGQPQFSEGRAPFWTPNTELERLGPV